MDSLFSAARVDDPGYSGARLLKLIWLAVVRPVRVHHDGNPVVHVAETDLSKRAAGVQSILLWHVEGLRTVRRAREGLGWRRDCAGFQLRDCYRFLGQAKGDIPFGGVRGGGFPFFWMLRARSAMMPMIQSIVENSQCTMRRGSKSHTSSRT